MKKHILHIILISLLFALFSARVAVAAETHSDIGSDKHTEATISVKANSVEIKSESEQALPLNIYALTGQVVFSIEAEPMTTTRVELRPGYYVVKIGDTTKRIIVRS